MRAALLSNGGYNWKMMARTERNQLLPLANKCAPYLRDACKASSWQQTRALHYEIGRPGGHRYTAFDLAVFLLIRGPYAWIGHGWSGCVQGREPANGTRFLRPAAFDVDYGRPLGLCAETRRGAGTFARAWSKASITVDCNTGAATIDAGRRKGRAAP